MGQNSQDKEDDESLLNDSDKMVQTEYLLKSTYNLNLDKQGSSPSVDGPDFAPRKPASLEEEKKEDDGFYSAFGTVKHLQEQK